MRNLLSKFFKRRQWIVLYGSPMNYVGPFKTQRAAQIYAAELAPGEFGVQGTVVPLDPPR
jgi:hypothetical protein